MPKDLKKKTVNQKENWTRAPFNDIFTYHKKSKTKKNSNKNNN